MTYVYKTYATSFFFPWRVFCKDKLLIVFMDEEDATRYVESLNNFRSVKALLDV